MNIVLFLIFATFEFLPIASTQSCNQGTFGKDCALQCHCRDNSCFNDVKSEGCQSGTCSPGYTGFPGCQTICPQGTFGVNCEGRCHCTPVNRCLHTNGNCEVPNRCVPERTGPNCQIVRPKLTDPPTVKINCTTVLVSWRGLKEKESSEIPDIRQYRIEIRETHSDAFVEARTVDSHTNASDHSESFDDRQPDNMITFRIVPVFFVDTGSGDGYLEDGIPSPPSEEVDISADETAVGPKSCALIGLGQTWAIFTWRPSQPSCHLGSLLGYELSTVSTGSEVIVQRFLANTTATVLLASDLSPGTEYKAEVLARFQKGNVRCVNSPLGSFKTAEPGFYSVEINTRERRYDNLALQLSTNSSTVQPKQYYVVSSAVRGQLAVPVDAGVWSFLRVQSAPFHLTLTNLQPATEYRVYAWAPSVDGTDFQGTSAVIWTSPKPFATSPNFRIDPLLRRKPSDTSVEVFYPNVSGYTGGLITDYYLAISPGHVGLEIAPVPSSGGPEDNLSRLRRQLSLPSSARIVHHSHTRPTGPITIGDGLVTVKESGSQGGNLFSDPPLTPASAYTLFVVVQSAVEAGGAETSPTLTFFFDTLPARSSKRTQILVAVVLALLFVLLACLLAYFFYRRRKRQESSKVLNNYFSFRPNRDIKEMSTIEETKLDALPKSYAAWSLPAGKRDPRFLIIDPTKGPDSTLLGTKSLDEVAASFKREFDSLPTGRILPHSAGMKTLNRYKNRSEHSLPYDHSRVKLKRRLNSPENDYINASFVDGYMRRKAYIAAQSPFNATTAADFWVMIFQCNVSQIVMLTNRIEGGTVCCTKYWPEVEQERAYDEALFANGHNNNVERQYDSLLVLALDSTEYANFTLRRFQISDLTSGAVQLVNQYQFHDWQPRRLFCSSGRWHRRGSSSGCQAVRVQTRTAAAAAAAEELTDFDCLAFIDFYFHVVTARRPEDGPLLVHCEEGVSRTSVFLAFDMLLQQFLTEHSVSVARLCAGMRRARPNMVPTPRHYALLYDLLYEAGIGGQSLIDLNVRSVLKSLIRRNPALGITYLTEQWYLLHNFTPPLDRRTDSLTALASINVAKNRFPNILDLLPPDRFRPRLPPNYHSLDLPADYINAVYLDTVGLRDDLILTQTPLRSTVLDFWRMVFEERVSCIVDVEPSCYGCEDAVRYWPVSLTDHRDSVIFEDLVDFHTSTYPFDLADAEVVEALGASTAEDESPEPPFNGPSGPWFQFGDFQLCQMGDLRPVLSSPTDSESKAKRRSCIFRRHLIIRKVDKSSLAKPPDSRTVQVFHFKGRWREEGQIPASRAQFLRLLEVVRLERGLGPTVIHCLDGGTKSGLFAASFILVERITRDLFVDVFHTIKAIKLRRRAVIGSATQLRFLYRVLIDWVDQTIEKPLRRQQITYPITLVRDPLLSTINDVHSSGLLSSGTSRLSLVSTGDSLPRAGEEAAGVNMSNSMSAVYHPPRRNVVLYRYFSEELSKLMRSGRRVSWSAAEDAADLGSQTVTSSPRRTSRGRVSQRNLMV